MTKGYVLYSHDMSRVVGVAHWQGCPPAIIGVGGILFERCGQDGSYHYYVLNVEVATTYLMVP